MTSDATPAPGPLGLQRFAWFVFLYTLATVAWGAIVRATGSGDGCGVNWPLCDGQVLPVFESNERIIEFSHRVSSGLLLPFVIGLVFWIRSNFVAGHTARKAAYGALFMTLLEAMIGMLLVRMAWVDRDSSVGRVVVMGFHTVSTFILCGFLAATIWAVSTGSSSGPRKGGGSGSGQGALPWMLLFCLGAVALLGISGAISALGHQLWPVDDVLAAAADSRSPLLVRLQPTHPMLAATVGLLIVLTVGLMVHLRPHPNVRRAARWVAAAFGAEMVLGLINVLLGAPVWMQAAHLVVADATFASLVVLGCTAFAPGVLRREESGEQPEPKLRGQELAKAYWTLTKPRVISLLLFTTMMAAFAAGGGWPGFGTFFALLIGGYGIAGAANVINMVIDRDIDGVMERTAKRPTVTEAISSTHALFFAGALAWGSFALIAIVCNLVAASLGLAGLVFYVIVYTLLLKRRTWQNIVIGGAAGAFPPLVGWAAVAGNLSPLALYLFAIIFVWTPVHFWALALLIKDEYAKADVPMLPVVRGDRATVVQIAWYTAATVLVTALPYAQGYVGTSYLAAALLLNFGLVWLTAKLFKTISRTNALWVFKFSMLYLALLFLMVAVDRSGAA